MSHYLKGMDLPICPDNCDCSEIELIIKITENNISSLIEAIEDCELGFSEHRGMDYPEGLAMALLKVELDLKAHQALLKKLKILRTK